MTRKRIYSDEERKERRKITQKKYYEKNKEKLILYYQTHYRENKEAHQERVNNYRKNWCYKPIGRACSLLSAYNQADMLYNRGKGDLTAKWIVENIFSKPCAHCGKEGWKIIGCNRLDNTKPHSKDNVEPCCRDCNLKLAGKEKQIRCLSTHK